MATSKKAMQLGDGSVQDLARKRISYKQGTKSVKDFMPKKMRKVADFGNEMIGSAASVGNNARDLVKATTGRKLPDPIRRTLNNPVAAVAQALEKVTKHK